MLANFLPHQQMPRISGLFHRRQKEGRHSDVDENPPPSSFTDDSGNGSSQNPPRLVRSPCIRGLRNEDSDPPRLSLNNAADHFSESAFPTANLPSAHPSNSKLASPLPSPPRSPVVSSQVPSLWPLPSPRQFPRKGEDSERHANGFHDCHADTANALPIERETHESSRSTISKEHSSLPGLPVSSTVRSGGKAYGSSGHGVPLYPITKQSNSGPNERISNSQKETFHWTPDQAIYGERVATNEFSSAEFNHAPKYHLQNVRVSKNIGHPSQVSQDVGSPNVPSPPLSPSSTRALSPGGWIKGHLLGCGAFGKVYKGIHSGTGEFCAIKEVEFVQNDDRSRECAEQLKKEIAFLSSLQHPNIVQYKGSELISDNLYIYLELVSGGSLYKLYQEFKKLEEPVIRRYTRQILHGLVYLHERKFVHRDIKCANILVDQDGTIKLADFGVSKYIKEQGVPFSLKGSPHWMAPEIILSTNTGYEYAVDIWSLGCTVIEMVTGRPPWCDLEPAAAMFKITKVGAPPIPDILSAEGKSFIRLCLQRHPAGRPTAADLLEHPFVKFQNGTHHNVVHAFEPINNAEYGEVFPASSSSSALSVQPSLSAPSSPRSSYRPTKDFNSIQQSFQAHHGAGADRANVKLRKPMYDSVPPPGKFGKPKAGIPPTGRRQSHEFSQTQARPSLSAPGSPKSPRMHGYLYPSLSGDILPGYPTPFSESRRV